MSAQLTYQDEDLLPLSGIQHYAFCPRQWALIHIEQQWAENSLTVDGNHIHERCHDETIRERRGDLLIVRGLRVTSYYLGLFGVCDVVEFHQNTNGIQLNGEEGLWNPAPIEYKRGHRKAENADRVQVCAQAMALEEMFFIAIDTGFLFYDAEKRRETIALTPELRDETAMLAKQMHTDYCRGYTPPPKKRQGCGACSCKSFCVPQIERIANVEQYISKMICG